MDIQNNWQIDRHQTVKKTDRQTDKQIGGQTDTQSKTDRHTGIQTKQPTDRGACTCRYRCCAHATVGIEMQGTLSPAVDSAGTTFVILTGP